jgi:hypothetical protein
MLRVVEDACNFTPDKSRGLVVVESDESGPPFHAAFHELDSQDTRNLAQSYAGEKGMGTAWINGNVIGPYPVNFGGRVVRGEPPRAPQPPPLPQTHPRMQPRAYRVDVPLARPLR